MKKLYLTCFALLLLGSGCDLNGLSRQKVSDPIPFGFTKFEEGGLSFVYPENLTVAPNKLQNKEGFDWKSNIITLETTSEEADKACKKIFAEAYPTERPVYKLLNRLATEGLTHENYSDLLDLDAFSCNGFSWSPVRALPLNVGGVKGMISYGCAGNSGDCTPEVNWVTVTLAKTSGEVYLVTFRPIFGNLINQDLKYNLKTEEDWRAVNAASSAILSGSMGFYDPRNTVFWFDDLVENIKVINKIISTIKITN